jgi:ribonuclease P protein component
MTTHRYPRSARLRRGTDFRRVLGRARPYAGAECVVRAVPGDAGAPRLGIAAPRRYGKAVRRNRFRRLVREAFRTLAADLGAWDLLVSPRKGLVEPTLAGVRADLEAACAAARERHARKDARGGRP